MKPAPFICSVLSILVALSACSGVKTKAEYPTSRFPGDADASYGQRQGIFGKGGLNLFGGQKEKDKLSGITVNAYLWRAALDTISFMPIDKADPFGGTIITEWYSTANMPNERAKVNIFIMGRELRTDAIKVTLFRQVYGYDKWMDVAVDPGTAKQLEETILTRARQLRAAAGTEVE